MRTTLQVTTQPTSEPVSLALAKQHCRVDQSADDSLISGYITAARAMAESYLSRALITQTLTWTMMPEWPVRPSVHFLRGPLDLPRAPVQDIQSVTALDTRGNSTALSPATLPIVPPVTLQGYYADLTLSPARLVIGIDTVLVDGRTFRNAALQHLQVVFDAGYPAVGTPPVAPIPQPILNAILLTVAFLYEHRGDAGGELPQAAQWLLDPFRIPWVA